MCSCAATGPVLKDMQGLTTSGRAAGKLYSK